jgi:hypothetical protein
METELRKQVRSLRRTLAVLALVVAALVVDRLRGTPAWAGPAPGKAVFDEVEVRRLTVVGPGGKRRLVLTPDVLPSVYKGREFHRQASPGTASILFFDEAGDEVGGIAFGKDRDGQSEVISFDYSRLPLDGIKMGLAETARGGGCFLLMRDAPPPDVRADPDRLQQELRSGKPGAEVEKFRRHGHNRIALGTEDRTASVVLTDTHGRKRVVLAVDRDDRPRIEVLDGDGKVIARLPQK